MNDIAAARAVNHHVGVLVDRNRNLHTFINGVDQGVAASNIPEKVDFIFVVKLLTKCNNKAF